jgi:hypothetical protein
VSSIIGVDEATPPLSGVLVDEAFPLFGKSWNARAGAMLCPDTMNATESSARENFLREYMLVGMFLMSEKSREIERADL